MSQFLYYLLLNTTYFAREDILLWQSKYIFSGKVSISSWKMGVRCGWAINSFLL